MNLKAIRRRNLRLLAEQVGGVTRLAERLGKHQSQISHVIGTHPVKHIGDRLAAQVELIFQKPQGWLDRDQEIETNTGSSHQSDYGVERKNILCVQVPLIDWDIVPRWREMRIVDLKKNKECLISAAIKVSSWAFALKVRDDSMESSGELSIPEGAIILVEPDAVARNGSLVVVSMAPLRGVTLKQFVLKEGERYLKPLNTRYPILKYTMETQIHGVVKQVWMDFENVNQKHKNQLPGTYKNIDKTA